MIDDHAIRRRDRLIMGRLPFLGQLLHFDPPLGLAQRLRRIRLVRYQQRPPARPQLPAEMSAPRGAGANPEVKGRRALRRHRV